MTASRRGQIDRQARPRRAVPARRGAPRAAGQGWRLTRLARRCKLVSMRYRFGDFTLDTEQARLTGPLGDVVLRRQAWRLLTELLSQAPALVNRDDLLDRVWGRQALSPNALPQTISELRQALGDDARKPRYIETCHGRGYRLVCPVEVLDTESSVDQASGQSVVTADPAPRPSGRKPSWPLAAMAGLAVVTVALGWVISRSDAPIDSATPASASADEQLDRLRRQAEVALARHDPAAAAAHLRALSLLLPAESTLTLQLAEAELDALQGDQARRTLSLLAAKPELTDHPRLLLLQARLASIDGDLAQAERLAEAARQQAFSLDQAEDYVAAARIQALASRRQGHLEQAVSRLEEAINAPISGLEGSLRLGLMIELGALHREQGQLDRARGWLVQAESLLETEQEQLTWQIEQSLVLSSDGQPQAAWDALQSAADRVARMASPPLELAWLNALGQVGIEVGELEAALDAFERGFALARASGQAYQVAGLQINTGSLLARRDRFEEAERFWQQALETFEQIGDRRGRATALGNLAAAASAQGHNTRATTLNQQALTEFRALELDGPKARTAFNLALIASRQGELDQAELLLQEAQEAYQRLGHVDMVLHVGAVRVDHRLLAGDLLLAGALLDELEALGASASPLRRGAVLASRGRFYQWHGDLPAARRAFEAAREQRLESGQPGWVATSDLELLQLAMLEDGDPWALRVQALALADRFDAMQQTRAAARARLLAAEALLSQGETEAARQELSAIRGDLLQFADTSLALDLAWAEAWAAREEERIPRLESLARQALAKGYLGKLAQIDAGLAARDLSLASLLPDHADARAADDRLPVKLPAYARVDTMIRAPE